MTPRLLKVLVQPVFVTEDEHGELVEVEVQAVRLSAAQWRALDTSEWADRGTAAVSAELASRGLPCLG